MLLPSFLLAEALTISGPTTATNGGNALAGDDTLTITAGGSIDTTALADNAVFSSSGALSVINAGAISAGLTGVYLRNTTGDVRNSGSVTATGAGLVHLLSRGSTENTGTINAGYVGINFSQSEGSIVNRGTITSGSTGMDFHQSTGDALNFGTINAGYHGIQMFGATGRAENHGDITAGSNGIDAHSTSGVIENTGSVTAGYEGISVFQSSDLVIRNSGSVFGAYRTIAITGQRVTLQIAPGSNIAGVISFRGTDNVLDFGAGSNSVLTIDDDMPDVTSDLGTHFATGNVAVSLDPGQIAAERHRSADLGRTLHGLVRGQQPSSSGGVQVAQGSTGGPRVQPWGAAFGGVARTTASSSSTGHNSSHGGVLAGLGFGESFGVFLGGDFAGTKGAANGYETDASTVLGGIYGGLDLTQSARLDWSLALGTSDVEATRQIQNNLFTGFQTASGSYAQSFVSPAATLSFPIGSSGLSAGLEARYMALFSDGYTETGSTHSFTYGSRTTHMAALTPHLSWDMSQGGEAAITASAGVELRHYWGDPVTASAVGGALNFASIDEDFEARGFLRLDADIPLDDGWTLTGFTDLGYSSRGQIDLSGGLALTLTF